MNVNFRFEIMTGDFGSATERFGNVAVLIGRQDRRYVGHAPCGCLPRHFTTSALSDLGAREMCQIEGGALNGTFSKTEKSLRINS